MLGVAPVAQLCERRLPRNGKSEHGSDRSERHEAVLSGRTRGTKRRGERPQRAALRSQNLIKFIERTHFAPVAQLGERRLPRNGNTERCGHRT